ncbi:hypothetical protein BYT27DRAFT_7077656 [Phlegmacium glaucopus]|nr:hypothetical protein BYT27DRAFT_7077656 [Phlegmacium glaucopus]
MDSSGQECWTDTLVGRLPSTTDYPLWRVRCRIGAEEEAIFSLCLSAADHHKLRSCFTCGSIRGWIYLEATMNPDLVRHLAERTPGIVVTRLGIEHQIIPYPDSIKMLSMHTSDGIVEEGKWVRVRKGRYKGDVSLVVAVEFWGAEVLLVPRLKSRLTHSTPNSLKRK